MENVSERIPLDEDRLRKRYVKLLRIAYLILLVQNCLLLIPYIGFMLIIIIPFDLVGFLLLALGYILYSTRESEKRAFYFGGGMCMLGWVICRITYQFILPFTFEGVLSFSLFIFAISFGGLVPYPLQFNMEPYVAPYTQYMAIFFILGSVLLGIASIFIFYPQKGKAGALFMVYGMINLIIVVFMLFPVLTISEVTRPVHSLIFPLLLLKLFFVPLLGAIAFYMLRASYFPEIASE